MDVLPADLHGLGYRHAARGPYLTHLAAQPLLPLIVPHDPLARLQPGRLQPFPELSFFQVAWDWGSAFVCRGRFSRIPSRGSSVYRLSRV